jgi:polyisoprenoid-binding protein YceI
MLLGTLLILAAGCARNPADEAPHATTGEAVSPHQAPVPAPAEAVTLPIRPQNSKITWKGSKVTRIHDGGFSEFEGAVHLVEGDPQKSHVQVTIQTASIYADDKKLTLHLKSPDFFDVDVYPTATFSSTRIQRKQGNLYEVTGDLRMHGVTRPVTFPATIEVQPGAVRAQAEFAIRRFDWNIKYPGKADDLIRDEVVLRLDIKAAGAEAGSPGASPGQGVSPPGGAGAGGGSAGASPGQGASPPGGPGTEAGSPGASPGQGASRPGGPGAFPGASPAQGAGPVGQPPARAASSTPESPAGP